MFKVGGLRLRSVVLVCGVLTIVCMLAGCEAFVRKFTRKPNKEQLPREEMVLVPEEYKAPQMTSEELYRQHFLFWKSWQGELIDRMGDNYKKRTECYYELMQNLLEMQKYLNDQKYNELGVFITEIKSVDPDVKKIDLRGSEQYRITQVLEKTKRLIDKRFSYTKVKDFLELRK